MSPLRLLSHSSLTTLHSCPRKFELYRLSPGGQRSSSVDTAFGSSFGAGIQKLIETEGNLPQSLVTAFIAWDIPLLEENNKSNKSFWEVVIAIEAFARQQLPVILADWEVARLIDGKPAVELSFRIKLPNSFSYRGFVDLVLKHRRENRFKIWELKTTGSYSVNIAQYQNSFQGVGYGVVLDSIAQGITGAESDYFVDYFVYKTKAREFEIMPFLKSNLERIKWLSQLLTETKVIQLYEEAGAFPMHGESCFNYFRPCEYFGICQMSNSSLVPPAAPAEEDAVDFEFSFEELLNQQERKLTQ